MKYLFILLFAFCLNAQTILDGDRSSYWGAAAAGCSKGTTIFYENFEAIADGEEWSNDGDWNEPAASTDLMIGDDDSGPPERVYAGNLAGLVENTTGGYPIQRNFTERITGYLSLDTYMQFNTVAATISQVLTFVDGTVNKVEFYVSPSAYLQIKHNTTLTNIVAISADTYYHIEMQINIDQSDGIGATLIWIDGTEYGPYDTGSRSDPSGIDGVRHYSDSSTNAEYWVDNELLYEGERCGN